jgi:hypothetical protein
VTTKIDDGGPAHPTSLSPDGPFGGMTLRDYFAGQALAGEFASQNEYSGSFPTEHPQEGLVARAELMYRMADAMIAARKGGA